MLWNEIIGQKELGKKLRNLVNSNKLPHAILFSGSLGYGSMSIARALTTYVQCRDRQEEDACGVCDQCKKNATLENPDTLLSFPTISQGGPSTSDDFYADFIEFQKTQPYGSLYQWLSLLDAVNKQANITAKECKRLVERLALKPLSASHKVLIIWLPEYLGKEGNRLLKLIEEPTQHTLIILVSEDTSRLLPTIKSRVQEVQIPPISSTDIASQAAKTLPLLHAKEPQYASYRGDWAKVLESSQPADTDPDSMLRAYLNAVFANRVDAQVSWVDTMNTYSRTEVIRILDYIHDRLYKLLRAPENTKDGIVLKLRSLDISLEQLEEWSHCLQDTQYAISRNTQIKLSLHALVIRSSYIVQNVVLS